METLLSPAGAFHTDSISGLQNLIKEAPSSQSGAAPVPRLAEETFFASMTIETESTHNPDVASLAVRAAKSVVSTAPDVSDKNSGLGGTNLINTNPGADNSNANNNDNNTTTAVKSSTSKPGGDVPNSSVVPTSADNNAHVNDKGRAASTTLPSRNAGANTSTNDNAVNVLNSSKPLKESDSIPKPDKDNVQGPALSSQAPNLCVNVKELIAGEGAPNMDSNSTTQSGRSAPNSKSKGVGPAKPKAKSAAVAVKAPASIPKSGQSAKESTAQNPAKGGKKSASTPSAPKTPSTSATQGGGKGGAKRVAKPPKLSNAKPALEQKQVKAEQGKPCIAKEAAPTTATSPSEGAKLAAGNPSPGSAQPATSTTSATPASSSEPPPKGGGGGGVPHPGATALSPPPAPYFVPNNQGHPMGQVYPGGVHGQPGMMYAHPPHPQGMVPAMPGYGPPGPGQVGMVPAQYMGSPSRGPGPPMYPQGMPYPQQGLYHPPQPGMYGRYPGAQQVGAPSGPTYIQPHPNPNARRGGSSAQQANAQGAGAPAVQQFSAPPNAYAAPQQLALPMGHHMHPFGVPVQGQQMFYPNQPGQQQMFASQPPHAGYAAVYPNIPMPPSMHGYQTAPGIAYPPPMVMPQGGSHPQHMTMQQQWMSVRDGQAMMEGAQGGPVYAFFSPPTSENASGGAGQNSSNSSSVASSTDQCGNPTATSSARVQEGVMAGDMDFGMNRARSHKPNLAHFLQYGLMLAGDELLVEPGVRMKLTNRSRHIARRLELLETPKLGEPKGSVGHLALEFLESQGVDVDVNVENQESVVDGEDGRAGPSRRLVRVVFAACHAPGMALWAAAGFPDPSETVEVEGKRGSAEALMLEPLLRSLPDDHLSPKCTVAKIHGRELPEEKRFPLADMRRLLLEDPEYRWDSASGKCALQTTYRFEGGEEEDARQRLSESGACNAEGCEINGGDLRSLRGFGQYGMPMKPPSSIDMAWSAGYASFAENASDPLMSHTLEGRGCSDDDLCLPLTDLLAGPAHDNTSWVDGGKGLGMPTEIEWESFLSFGGDGFLEDAAMDQEVPPGKPVVMKKRKSDGSTDLPQLHKQTRLMLPGQRPTLAGCGMPQDCDWGPTPGAPRIGLEEGTIPPAPEVGPGAVSGELEAGPGTISGALVVDGGKVLSTAGAGAVTATGAPGVGPGVVKEMQEAGPKAGPGARDTGPNTGPGVRDTGPNTGPGARDTGPNTSPGARDTGPNAGPGAREAGLNTGPGAREAEPNKGPGAPGAGLGVVKGLQEAGPKTAPDAPGAGSEVAPTPTQTVPFHLDSFLDKLGVSSKDRDVKPNEVDWSQQWHTGPMMTSMEMGPMMMGGMGPMPMQPPHPSHQKPPQHPPPAQMQHMPCVPMQYQMFNATQQPHPVLPHASSSRLVSSMIHLPVSSGTPALAAQHSPPRQSSTTLSKGQEQGLQQGQGRGQEERERGRALEADEPPSESDLENNSSSAMMKEWMEFHKLAHMLMESVQCTVCRSGDPPSSEMQQSWATKSYSVIGVVATWAAKPSSSSLTVKKQHSVVVGTAGIVMETLEMLLNLQQHHRRKCPPKKQECFLAGLVCNWGRALLEHSTHVALLRDSNHERVREDLHLDHIRKSFRQRVFHRPTFMKDADIKDFKHFILDEIK